MRIRALSHSDDFLIRGIRLAVSDVFPDRAGKQRWLLKDNPHGGSHLLNIRCINIRATDRERARINGIQAHEQIDQSGLPAARLTHECDLLPMPRGETDAIQHRLTSVVSKGHLIKAHHRLLLRQGRHRRCIQHRHIRCRRRGNNLGVGGFLHLFIHHLEIITRTGNGALGRIHQPTHHLYRVLRHGNQLDQHHHVTDGEATIQGFFEQNQINAKEDHVHGHATGHIHGVPPA